MNELVTFYLDRIYPSSRTSIGLYNTLVQTLSDFPDSLSDLFLKNDDVLENADPMQLDEHFKKHYKGNEEGFDSFNRNYFLF